MFGFLKEPRTWNTGALKKLLDDERKCHRGIRDSCCKLACNIRRRWPDVKIWNEVGGGGYIGGPEDAEEHLGTPLHAFYKLEI